MKRQPLISSYSKVFNFCFNLLDALSLVFKYFSSAKYRKFALIFLFIYILTVNVHFSLPRMGVIWKFSHRNKQKKVLKLFFILLSFKNFFKKKEKCKRKKKIASSALKFVRRSKTIMHIDFSRDKLLTTWANTYWSITWSKNGKLTASLYKPITVNLTLLFARNSRLFTRFLI